MTIEKTANCDSEQVAELVKDFVEEAEKDSDVGAELSFILPSSSSGSFPGLFDSLEGEREHVTRLTVARRHITS